MDGVEKLIDSMKRVVKSELGSYDTTATVRRVEGDTAWVHIPGGVDETPVRLTINASEGDSVQVRVSDGKAFMVGNGTAPPTDDARANQAYTVATVAEGAAENALGNAARAKEAADSAQASAATAESAAGAAVTAAGNAQTAADTALVNLATTENVVGVLNWITAHGTMTLTSDVTVNPAHVYFVVDAGGDYVVGGTHYSVVAEPTDDDIATYYELTVDESVQNYVATHIVVDTEGLWIIPDSGGNKVLIATGSGSTYTTAGTYIVGKVNNIDTVFAKFTAGGTTVLAESGTQIAHLGYGEGNSSGGGTAEAPYYTLGERLTSANNYDASERYSFGDVCTYNDSIYVCITNIYTPEAWDSSHWVEAGLFIGNYSVAEGYHTSASGEDSHAEGYQTFAVSSDSHAEGNACIAAAGRSHAEGYRTLTKDTASHAEGDTTIASGYAAHAEGNHTEASGMYSHAEGYATEAIGDSSHAQNRGTIAASDNQTVLGKNNIVDSNDEYAVIIGNGTDNNSRSNALTVDWSGNVEAGGDITAGGNVEAARDISGDSVTTTIVESSGTYSNGINDEALLTTATINKWKTILGIS